MSTTRTTLLVDGNYLLKRSFESKSNRYTKEFGNIDGLFNFFLTLRTVTKELSINKIIVFWDGVNGGKLRYDLYKGYKANRSNKEWYNKRELSDAQIKFEQQRKESMLNNKIRIQNYLEELFIRQVYDLDLIEADDMIAYYVSKYHNDEYLYIYTNDRDLCQLIDYDNVNIYLANKKAKINSKNYFLYFNHHLKNLPLVKTFCGDTSDNIKGVNGLGESTLLKHFPFLIKRESSINEILEEANKIANDIKLLNEATTKKTKLKVPIVINNIINGVNQDKEIMGNELYELNYKLINLKEPFLTKEAKYDVVNMGTSPIDDTNRGSNNLIKLMKEDGFLSLWNGSISQFCSPFYPTIIKEKSFSKNS